MCFFSQAALAMFGYMTELDKVEIDEDMTCEFEVEGEWTVKAVGIWPALSY